MYCQFQILIVEPKHLREGSECHIPPALKETRMSRAQVSIAYNLHHQAVRTAWYYVLPISPN